MKKIVGEYLMPGMFSSGKIADPTHKCKFCGEKDFETVIAFRLTNRKKTVETVGIWCSVCNKFVR